MGVGVGDTGLERKATHWHLFCNEKPIPCQRLNYPRTSLGEREKKDGINEDCESSCLIRPTRSCNSHYCISGWPVVNYSGLSINDINQQESKMCKIIFFLFSMSNVIR